jgi:chemotaxis response regulator CheB
MRRIRILLVWLPTLLRDILTDAVAREWDMEIVATAETRVELETLVRRFQPDVVVTGSPGSDAGAVANDVRQIAPSVVVVAIAQKGDRATLFSSGSTPLEIPDVSTDTLLKAIRDHSAANGSTRLPPTTLS